MENEKYINLNPRLKKIAELVPPCGTVADIGTDHAYIPVSSVLSGKAVKAIASDIKKGPVDRARETVSRYDLTDKIDIRLGPGLETVSPGEADTIIIAGMGGILIADILTASQKTVRSAQLLILQPMTAVLELREYLSENGYAVLEEHLVCEDDKIYNILVVKPDGNTDYSLKELYLGKGLDTTSPQLYPEYRQRILTKLQKRLNGLSKSALEENRIEFKRIDNIIREIAND